MRRHRGSTALLAVVLLALGACVLLVPQARTAPAEAVTETAPDPATGVAVLLRGPAAEQVLSQVHAASPSSVVAASVLSATGLATALILVNQALTQADRARVATAADLTRVVLQADGSAVVVLPAPAGSDAADDVVALPVGTTDALLTDTGRQLRALAMTRASTASIVTASPTPTAAQSTDPAPSATAGPTPTPTPAPAPAGPAAAAPAAGPNCAVDRCVALTFDDGPGPYTAALLDELAARGAPATFFLVGRNIAKHPEVVAREAAQGNALGSHTWNHAWLTKLSAQDVAAELDQTAAAIQATAGVTPTLVRPPYGAYDDQALAVLASRGDAAICWSVDTEDWKNRDAGITTQRALEAAAPGSIILMHDIHPSTVEAVPGIIDGLRAAGYTLVTVPQLLGTTTPGQVYRHG